VINLIKFFLKTPVLVALILIHQVSVAQPTQEEMDKIPAIKDAYLAETKGNYKAAVRFYRHAYANNTGKLTALAGIVRSLNRIDQASSAEAILKEEIKMDPFDLELRLLAADHYASSGSFPQALVELGVAEKVGTGDHRVYLRRGIIYQKMNKLDLAIKDLSISIEKSTTAETNAFLRRAQCYFAISDYVNAEKDIRKVHQLEPLVTETLVTFMKILVAQKKFPEAAPLAQQCTEVDPQNVVCWDMRGELAREMNNPVAITYFERAVALTPNDSELRKKLADVLDLNGKFQEADSQYVQVQKLRPDYEASMRNHVASLMKRKSYSMATDVLAAFHKSDPKNLWVSVEYASLMAVVGRFDAAVSALRETRRANRSDIADMYYGHALFQSGEYSSAEDAIEDIKDQSLAKNYNLGITLLRRKKWAKAVAQFEKVKPESKNFYQAQINKAIAMQEDGKVDNAINVLGSTSFPSQMKETISKHIQFLTDAKSRKPSSLQEKDGPLQAFTEWELPQL